MFSVPTTPAPCRHFELLALSLIKTPYLGSIGSTWSFACVRAYVCPLLAIADNISKALEYQTIFYE